MNIENKTLIPVERIRNGTVIAVGNVAQNQGFYNYGNHLISFVLKDKKKIFYKNNRLSGVFIRLDFIDLKG